MNRVETLNYHLGVYSRMLDDGLAAETGFLLVVGLGVAFLFLVYGFRRAKADTARRR